MEAMGFPGKALEELCKGVCRVWEGGIKSAGEWPYKEHSCSQYQACPTCAQSGHSESF